MRIIFAAALALSPSLLLAQTNSPAAHGAQTSQKTVLQSTLVAPGTLGAAAATDRPAITAPVRVSTGVTAPTLISTAQFASDGNWHLRVPSTSLTAEVDMIVDATGTPTNLKIVRSVGDFADRDILAAVGQYRFKPGKLDGEPTPVPVKLDVLLDRAARY